MAWPFFKKNKPNVSQIDEQSYDAEEAKKSSDSNYKLNQQKMRDFVIKAIGGVLSQSEERERFHRPEYNLWEIKEASESDSYVKISFSKYSYLIYKAGSSLKGDDERVSYLEKRFRMMSFSTQKPMDILFQEIADDLVKYSNAFLVKRRVDNLVGIKARPVLADKVVGGYFRVDPASVRIKRDKNGNVLKYEQGYGDNIKEFFPRDVVHFYMDKDANNAFGTPRVIAALEDVKLLRKIEGNVTALIYRFSLPLYQWMVGLPQQGMQATQPEIMKAQNEIERSTLDGIVVTNERTTIKTIGAEGSALNAEGYLKYFEDKVFSALGVSASQMGRGGAKQDSESMEAQIHDTVKYIQRIMSIFIKEKILSELLLEGGYNPILNEEDIVEYEFEEISLETKIKKENHEVTKWQGNVNSLSETRRKMGMKDNPDDEDRLYKNFIETNARMREIDRTAEHQKELADINAGHQKDLAKINAANKPAGGSSSQGGSAANKSPRSNKRQAPNKDAVTKNRPQNQYGTHSAKVKESHDIESGQHKKQFKKIFKTLDDMRNDIENGEDAKILFPITSNCIKEELNRLVDFYSLKAVQEAVVEINTTQDEYRLMPNEQISLTDFYEEIDESVSKFFKECKQECEKTSLDKAVDMCEHRIRLLSDFVLRKTYWYSYVKTGALVGVKEAYIIFSSDKDAEAKENTIKTDEFSIEDIPAYHSFCNCEVTYNKEKAGENK